MRPKIFLDCGHYVGKALEYYAPFMDDSWLVYAFEPNTQLNVTMTSKRFPFPVSWVQKAVWIEDGEVDFELGGREDASHISSVGQPVPSLDFSKFVAELPQDAVIVCSMDIEGSEFPVLRKMLADKTAQRLSLLDIEFHHRLTNNEEDQASADFLRRCLEGEGVLVKLKVEIWDV